jgi:hypothetical protein
MRSICISRREGQVLPAFELGLWLDRDCVCGGAKLTAGNQSATSVLIPATSRRAVE